MNDMNLTPDLVRYSYKGIFTKSQQEKIVSNLKSYLTNFGYLKIEKCDPRCGNGFLVYTDKYRAETGTYTQFCPNIDYLDGWLYGAVQAINLIMEPVPYDKRVFNIDIEF